MSDTEISTMWSAYAHQGSGVAIMTTVGKLIQSYTGDERVSILNVDYIDHREQVVQTSNEPINALRFFAANRIFYKPENEIRLIYESLKENEYEFFQIPVNINTLIKELRLGPNAGDDILEMIRTVVSVKGGVFPVRHSELLYP